MASCLTMNYTLVSTDGLEVNRHSNARIIVFVPQNFSNQYGCCPLIDNGHVIKKFALTLATAFLTSDIRERLRRSRHVFAATKMTAGTATRKKRDCPLTVNFLSRSYLIWTKSRRDRDHCCLQPVGIPREPWTRLRFAAGEKRHQYHDRCQRNCCGRPQSFIRSMDKLITRATTVDSI